MKVVSLGAGGMGRWVAQTVLLDERVAELTVADRNAEAADRAAASLGSRARPAVVDVLDAAALDDVLREAHVVINSAGPFYR